MEIYRTDDGHAQTADAVVLAGDGDGLSVLVVQRKFDPFKDCFAFPGGFLEKEERPFVGCLRELEEETGLCLEGFVSYPLSIREKKGRDPRGLTRTFPFLFHLSDRHTVQAADDAKQALWVPLKELGKLAFDHGAILCEALSLFYQGMPSAQEKLTSITFPSFISKQIEHSLCFYGGSFNPWHAGHSECLSQVEAAGHQVTVLPDSNPLKPLQEQECFWMQFKQLALRLESSPHIVYPGFLGLEKSNPTAHWISQLEEKPSFVLGDDNLFLIEKWIDYQIFLSSLKNLYIVPRNYSLEQIEEKVTALQRLFPTTRFVILEEHDYQELSSTELREKKS